MQREDFVLCIYLFLRERGIQTIQPIQQEIEIIFILEINLFFTLFYEKNMPHQTTEW